MKPTLDDMLRIRPGLDPRAVQEHIERLDEDYFQAFSLPAAAEHAAALSEINPNRPVEVVCDSHAAAEMRVTVLAFDYPGEFSLIVGALSSTGFDVESGEIFTYNPGPAGSASVGEQRRKIIDRFAGRIARGTSAEAWAGEFRERIRLVAGLLERGDQVSMESARRQVNEWAAARLANIERRGLPVLYPVDISADNSSARTTLKIVSQDTPFFLYALSSALAMQGVRIERVRISTSGGVIEDEMEISDANGAKIPDGVFLDKLKFSALLTKQFAYFVGNSPDPYAALCRFEQLAGVMTDMPDRGRLLETLSSPEAMRELAVLLGASDFIWEDFVRLQYETLLPMLQPHLRGRRFASDPEELAKKLRARLSGARTLDEKCAILNEVKDREIFLVDLDNILSTEASASGLAGPLTRLAELTVNIAVEIVFDDMAARHGVPRAVAGIEAEFAVFGLGKFGGEALGYASDIELLFVFGDNGRTDGPEPLENFEFFDKLARGSASLIRAKREGIFHVDLRLRPYGNSGPAASSLAAFCRYYGPGGAAHSYERLALTRLRGVGGSPALRERVERLRDSFLYDSESVNQAELRELREKQYARKNRPGLYNAKFSPGALVDLEYAIQMLQVVYGKNTPALRTPSIREALGVLSKIGVLEPDESARLGEAYLFLRKIINALRMLRGSAQDLFLPKHGSLEFAHLARRAGYSRGEGLEPEQKFYLDFETRTAYVRAFIERRLGKNSLPGAAVHNIADIVLSREITPSESEKILSGIGCRNPERAALNLRMLAERSEAREDFAWLAVLACEALRDSPDPDMALNNWERFVSPAAAAAHFSLMLAQPRRLEILMKIFSTSQFLSDTLARNPGVFDWVTDPAALFSARGADALLAELAAISSGLADDNAWLNAVRRFRRRETLRIGVLDICLLRPINEITSALSALAEAVIRACLDRVMFEMEKTAGEGRLPDLRNGFAVLALGKLGGRELNYSSDVDLMGIFSRDNNRQDESNELEQAAERAMRRLREALSSTTEEGRAYRVDLRLRPYGKSGGLVFAVSSLADYYGAKAELWELQAMLKARPVAGAGAVAEAFLARVREALSRPTPAASVVASIKKMRQAAVSAVKTKLAPALNVKTGAGGIRDVEFLVQGLEMINAHRLPDLLEGNTLAGLESLKKNGILPAPVCEQLEADYVFLRRVEHALQLFEDRQVHELPASGQELDVLAKRVCGRGENAASFTRRMNACRKRVRAAYTRFLLDAV